MVIDILAKKKNGLKINEELNLYLWSHTMFYKIMKSFCLSRSLVHECCKYGAYLPAMEKSDHPTAITRCFLRLNVNHFALHTITWC